MPTASDLIESLGLVPHPEGGHHRETYRSELPINVRGGRSASTLIYFLLRAGEVSRWHRVIGSDEIFLHQGGDPYTLLTIDEHGNLHETIVGLDVTQRQLPQHIVPASNWQAGYPAAGPHGYSLVACLVTPGFEFADFEMATDADMAERYPELAEQLRLPG